MTNRHNGKLFGPRTKQQVALGTLTQIFSAYDSDHSQVILHRLRPLRHSLLFLNLGRPTTIYVLAFIEVVLHACCSERDRKRVKILLLIHCQLLAVTKLRSVGQIESLLAAFTMLVRELIKVVIALPDIFPFCANLLLVTVI